MEIKKYKGTIADTSTEIIGYLIEQREYLGNGCYSKNKQYCICVTDFSMPNSEIRGCFLVDDKSIKDFYPCAVCGISEVKDEYLNSACSEKCYEEL